MLKDIAIGRLHREDPDWILVIVEHEGQDIRAIFRQDEVEKSGTGSDEIMGIKPGVIRKVPAPGPDGGTKLVEREFQVEPHSADNVRNRHMTPVVMSREMMDKIVARAKGSALMLVRP